jgi:hypothetical protein
MWMWQLEKALRRLPPLVGRRCFICKISGWYSSAVICDPGTMDMLCAQCAIDYAKMRRSAKRDIEQALRKATAQGGEQ